ncbi:MAG: RHS repeat-associated core domain-containing protein [Bradymonadia bacterium]
MGRTLKMGEHELAHDVRGTPIFSMSSANAMPVFRLRDVWGMPRGPQVGFADGRNYSVGYTNHMEDESGLTYMQARYYRPELGGFLSRDPVYHAGQGAGVYVDGNPAMMIDPDGRLPIDIPLFELIRATKDSIQPVGPTFRTLLEGHKRISLQGVEDR